MKLEIVTSSWEDESAAEFSIASRNITTCLSMPSKSDLSNLAPTRDFHMSEGNDSSSG